MDQRHLLVLGGSGYVGSRLILSLLQKRFLVRATSRNISTLKKRPWANYPGLQLAETDVFNEDSLKKACQGVVVAYYLVQCADQGYWSFPKLNRRAAENFLKAAEAAGVERIVYLGRLGEADKVSSRLLKSMLEVDQILKSGKIPVTVFRADLILGSGNPSFEILRHIVDRFPVLPLPSWVHTECQPVSIRDAIECLVRCLEVPETVSQSFDVGGKEVLKYEKLMQIYSEEAGLGRRWVLSIKFLGVWPVVKWVGALTPLKGPWVFPLMESFRDKTICRDTKVNALIPSEYPWPRDVIKTMLYQNTEVIERNLPVDTLPLEWSMRGDPEWSGGTIFRLTNSATIAAAPEDAWRVLSRMGGKIGWYYGDWLWSLRGAIDRMLGGKGMKPGRKDDYNLKVGDPVDCWRIKIAEPLKRLLLLAELKIPGKCYWDFKIESVDSEKVKILQEIVFIPHGLPGFLFWHLLKPVHSRVFNGMVVETAKRVSLKII